MSVMTPAKVEKIAGMFARGYSLDLISEWGVSEGWTREDAKQVVVDKGWKLGWDQRLLDECLKRERAEHPREVPINPIGDADVERMLAVGIDHEVVEIRRLAVKAQTAIENLRSALILQEDKDAEEVASRRRAEAEHAAELADPSNWAHGTWGGYINHQQFGVPVCAECDAASEEYRQRMSVVHRRISHKRRENAVA